MTAWIASGIVAQPLLEEARESREQEAAVDALLVHQLETGTRRAERRDGAHRLAEDLAPRQALGVAFAEVVLLRARDARPRRTSGSGCTR